MSDIKLTTSEVGFLWSHYVSNSLNIGMLKYFLAKVEDQQTEAVLEYGMDCAQHIRARVADILTQENFPLPRAFGAEDVDTSAPRLFEDTGALYYTKRMSKLAGPAAALALGNSARADVREHFRTATGFGMELDERATRLMLEKGLYVRPPFLPAPKETKLAGDDFLGSLLGGKRPLFSIEIAHVFANIETNNFGTHIVAGFSQVARAKELREYFLRGLEIAKKHINVFSELLVESDLRAPVTWDAIPTVSTTPPFSDKFMLTLVTGVSAMGLGNYGAAIAASTRIDLAVTYTRLMAEVMAYLEDGTELMIENRWLEEPPGAPDRAALALARR